MPAVHARLPSNAPAESTKRRVIGVAVRRNEQSQSYVDWPCSCVADSSNCRTKRRRQSPGGITKPTRTGRVFPNRLPSAVTVTPISACPCPVITTSPALSAAIRATDWSEDRNVAERGGTRSRVPSARTRITAIGIDNPTTVLSSGGSNLSPTALSGEVPELQPTLTPAIVTIAHNAVLSFMTRTRRLETRSTNTSATSSTDRSQFEYC
jgi:hypothetical protein